MRTVVLGASGQIGKIIYEELKKSHEVIGTSRNSSSELLQFDPFKDSWSVLGKADVLVNCVGQIEATKEFSFQKIHIELTKLIIQNRERLGNPRIIQISALGASKLSELEFFKTKGIADDQLLKNSNTVIVRPSIICTHKTMMVRKMQVLYSISRFTNGLLIVPSSFLDHMINLYCHMI